MSTKHSTYSKELSQDYRIEQPSRRRLWIQAAGLSYLGFFIGGAFFLGYLIGDFLDKKYKTTPRYTYLCMLLGVVIGFNELYRVAKKHKRKLEEEEKNSSTSSNSPSYESTHNG